MHDVNLEYINPTLLGLAKKKFSKSYLKSGSLSCQFYSNALILPSKVDEKKYSGCVQHQDGSVIKNTTVHERCRDSYFVQETSADLSNEKVIFIGNFLGVWGHCITDNLKKLWFLKTEQCSQLLSNGWKCVYVTYSDDDVSPNFRHIVECLGLDFSKFKRVTCATKFSEVCVPDNSIVWENDNRYFYSQYTELINSLKLKCSDLNGFDKIYLSRSRFSNYRKEIGEKNVERAFARQGYKIIYPEQYSFEDQLALMQSAKEIVVTEGSCAHNVVFCNSGTKVVILQKSNYFNEYQLFINELAGLQVVYVNAHHSVRVHKKYLFAGPFYICFTKELKSYLKIKFAWPYFLRPSYYLYLFYDSLIVRCFDKLFNLICK